VDPYRAWLDGGGDGGQAGRGRAVLRASATALAGCDPRRGRKEHRDRCRRVWRDMSAVHHATGRDDAPMLLIHSRRDFVPALHSHALSEAERREGMAAGDIRVVTVPGAEHGGGLLRSPAVAERVLRWIVERGYGRGTAGPHGRNGKPGTGGTGAGRPESGGPGAGRPESGGQEPEVPHAVTGLPGRLRR
jgi:hypothetical protein